MRKSAGINKKSKQQQNNNNVSSTRQAEARSGNGAVRVETKKVEVLRRRCVGRANNNANANGGLVYANANNASSNSNANNGARLANYP